jgi:drug/metabolite transporter (DMT)-like permease
VSELPVILIALASAGAAATSSVLQHRSARSAPDVATHRFLGHLLTRPAWLAGLAAGAAGLVLHALALAGGGLAVVQPLLISGILFALPISVVLEGRRPSLTEWLWAALLVGGLATFLVAAHPSAGWVTMDADTLAWMTAVSALCVLAVVGIGIRWPGRGKALLYGIGAGLGYGLAAALLKQTLVVAGQGAMPVLTDWPLYAFIGVGAASTALTQLAYRSGPLSRSLPALTLLDPATSIVLGAAAFHELLADNQAAVAFQLGGLILTVIATARLATPRSQATGGPVLAPTSTMSPGPL